MALSACCYNENVVVKKILYSFVNFIIFLPLTYLYLKLLGRNLNEFFAFRQTQTAWGALAYDLFADKNFVTQTPVLGPPYLIPFEFPLYQWLHIILSQTTQLSIDYSGRLLSLLIFLLSAVFLFLIARFRFNRYESSAILILYLYLPFAVQWSTAVLIDFLSVLLILISIYLILRYKSSGVVYLLVTVLLSLAGAIKGTTLLTWIPILIFIFLVPLRKKLISLWPVVISLLFSIIWTMYADLIKSDNPYTEWLTSSNLRGWNFGNLKSRLNPENITTIFSRISDLMLGGQILTTFFIIILFYNISKSKLVSLQNSLLISILLGPSLFFNLYVVHDYYLIAIYPLIVFLFVLILNQTFKHFNLNHAFLFLIIGLVIFSSWTSNLGIKYYNNILSNPTIPEISLKIKEDTKLSDDIIFHNCNDWDPTIPYYAERRGLMNRLSLNLESSLHNEEVFEVIFDCLGTFDEKPPNFIDLDNWMLVDSYLYLRR